MSQVKHAQQINIFMEFARRNRLTSYDRMLWIALFHCANRLAMSAEDHEWPDDYFQVSNSEIYEWAGLEERAVRNSRNRLRQYGLIDFEKGDGKRHDPYYKINYLAVIGYKIVPVCVGDTEASRKTGGKYAADSAGDSVGDHVSDNAGDTHRTGGKYAADGAGGVKHIPRSPYIFNNKNINGGTEKEKANASIIGGGQKPGSFSGLVDLDEDAGGPVGLVSLQGMRR